MTTGKLTELLNAAANQTDFPECARQCRQVLVSAIDYIFEVTGAEKPRNASLLELIDSPVVTGYINDVHRIAALAHKHGAMIIVDGAQAASHIPFSMSGRTEEEIETDLTTALNSKFKHPFVLRFEWMKVIPPDDNGKLRMIVTKVKE